MKSDQRILLSGMFIFLLSLGILTYQLTSIHIKKSKPYIVCTTSIIADSVQEIGKSHIDVDLLMGPGIDPHLYKPVENDIIKLSEADIIFYNGLHLEARMSDIFQQISAWKKTIAISKDIDQSLLLPNEDYENMHDPHIWFDITLWMQAVNTICTALIQLDPQHTKDYQRNCKSYQAKLKLLLKKTEQMLNSIPQKNRILITGHDAFSYFGRLYNYQVIGLQGISTESAPGAQDVQNLVHFICDHNVPAIFIETSTPTKNIVALQEGVAMNHKTVTIGDELYSDALGPSNSSGNSYINMILHNATTIAKYLNSN